MGEDRGSLSKRIDSVFLLDDSKLRRLVNVIENKFDRFETKTAAFQASLLSGKNVSVESIEHVLDQDNAIRNPINELSIALSTSDDSSRAIVEFDRKDSEINIRVSSPDVTWATEIFGEIEEQVERTFVRSWVYSLKRSTFTAFMGSMAMLLVASMVTSFISPSERSESARSVLDEQWSINDRLLLNSADVERLQRMAQRAETTEDRLSFLLELHSAQINSLAQHDASLKGPHPTNTKGEAQSALGAILSDLGWPAVLIALPVVVILVVAWYLLARCYPGSIFSWGDYADHFRTLVERRRLLWNTIVIALAIGVIANLAVYGASRIVDR